MFGLDARATEAAAELLPAPTTEHHEVIFDRIQALASRTSEHASASLRFTNAQVAGLAARQEALESHALSGVFPSTSTQ